MENLILFTKMSEQLPFILHHVARCGSVEEANLLIQQGFDINTLDSKGYSPLHYAATRNNPEMVRYILSQGADVNKKTSTKADHSPLHYAAVVGNKEIIEMLLKAGADIKAGFSESLHVHTISSMLNLVCGVTFLRENMNTYFGTKQSGFIWYCDLEPKVIFDKELIRFLLEQGADTETEEIRFSSSKCDKFLYGDGLTPLLRACREGRLDIVKLLMSYGANVHARNYFGRTALHHAVLGGDLETIKFLLNNGFDINVGDLYKCTPLHYLVKANQDDAVPLIEFLVDNGAVVNLWTKLLLGSSIVGGTPLHVARKQDIVECLLELKADFNVETAKRMRPFQEQITASHACDKNAVLVAFMALTEESLYSPDYPTPFHEFHEIWESYFHGCKSQVRQMKNEYICEDRYVTYFDFLNKDLLKATVYGRCEELMRVLSAGRYGDRFPNYIFLFQKRIDRVRAILRFRDAAQDLIERYARMRLPISVVDQILNYLEVRDFRNVARSLCLIK